MSASNSLYSFGGGIVASCHVVKESVYGGRLGMVAAAVSASLSKSFFDWINIEAFAQANPKRVSMNGGMVNFAGPVLIADSSSYLYAGRIICCVVATVFGVLAGKVIANKLFPNSGNQVHLEDGNRRPTVVKANASHKFTTAAIALGAGGLAVYLTRNMPTQPGIYFW